MTIAFLPADDKTRQYLQQIIERIGPPRLLQIAADTVQPRPGEIRLFAMFFLGLIESLSRNPIEPAENHVMMEALQLLRSPGADAVAFQRFGPSNEARQAQEAMAEAQRSGTPSQCMEYANLVIRILKRPMEDTPAPSWQRMALELDAMHAAVKLNANARANGTA